MHIGRIVGPHAVLEVADPGVHLGQPWWITICPLRPASDAAPMACLWPRRSSAIFRSSGVRPVNWRDGLFPLSRVVPWPYELPRRLLPPSTPELPHLARHSRAHRPADLRAVRHGKDEGELPDTADDAPDAKTWNAHDGRHRYEAHIAVSSVRSYRAARTVAEALPGVPVWAIDADGLVVRPGPRLVGGVEAVASVLHPGAVPATGPGAVSRITPPS